MVVRGLEVFLVERAAHVSLFQLRVNGRQPVKEVIPRVTWFVIWREVEHEARADGGEPGLAEFFGDEKVRSHLFLLRSRRLTLRMRLCPRRINMIVHVDANGSGQDLCDAWINRIACRTQASWPEDHRAAGTH